MPGYLLSNWENNDICQITSKTGSSYIEHSSLEGSILFTY
jgi:hypothetical protein